MSKVSKFGLSFRNKMTTEVKPTKPLTSFFLFKRDNQAKVAEFPRGEQAKELGRLWQELSDDEKMHTANGTKMLWSSILMT